MAARADLHFHLLPGVDDGPQTVEQSLELARLAVADGTSTVVATPHVRAVDLDQLPARVAEFRAQLRAAGIALDVRCGGELAAGDVGAATDRQLQSISHGRGDVRWLLLEAPLPDHSATLDDLLSAAAELRARGFAVLLAHPERCDALFDDDAAALEHELCAGSLVQLNASSLLGRHGPSARRRALQLAKNGRASVVASDAHTAERGPALSAARHVLLTSGAGHARARSLIDVGPRTALDRGLRARPRAAPAAAR